MTLQEAKEQVAKIISDHGTWQLDNEGKKGTWIDTEDINSIADEVSEYAQSCAQEAREKAIEEVNSKIESLIDELFTRQIGCERIASEKEDARHAARYNGKAAAFKESYKRLSELLNLKEKKCQCSFAMIRRDQETQKAYCFECKKEIEE